MFENRKKPKGIQKGTSDVHKDKKRMEILRREPVHNVSESDELNAAIDALPNVPLLSREIEEPNSTPVSAVDVVSTQPQVSSGDLSPSVAAMFNAYEHTSSGIQGTDMYTVHVYGHKCTPQIGDVGRNVPPAFNSFPNPRYSHPRHVRGMSSDYHLC